MGWAHYAHSMRQAFDLMVRKAYEAAASFDEIPYEYQMQQQELQQMMTLMNSEFGRLLKFYCRVHAGEALSPTEEVEKARLTQLTFEGLTLELTTIDLGPLSQNSRLERKVWSTSVLFPARCTCAEQVEEQLIELFSADAEPETSSELAER